MKARTKFISLIAWVVDIVVGFMIVIGLCLDWLKPGSSTPEGYHEFGVNSYGEKSLRHTCKANSEAFNEGCLVYQGSVVAIILCASSLFTALLSVVLSGVRCVLGERIEKKEGTARTDKYVIGISTVHLMLFAQLFIAVVAYLTGSHRIRKDMGYKYGPGWFVVLAATVISLCCSVVLFFVQCVISKLASIVTLFSQFVLCLIPTGTFFILIGLCTSFYNTLGSRVNALKFKEVVVTTTATTTTGMSTPLKDYCDMDGSLADHMCSLYKSSAALIAFSVFGFLFSYAISSRLLDAPKKIVAIICTFVCFFVGFVQYAAVGAKVKNDLDLHYGIGWAFYLIGFILTSVGLLFNAADIVIFGREKDDGGDRASNPKDTDGDDGDIECEEGGDKKDSDKQDDDEK